MVEAHCSATSTKVWLGPATGRWTSLFPEDLARSATLGKQLSAKLNAPVIFTLVHDSDAFCCLLFEHGKATEEFVSRPDLMGGLPSAAQVPERIIALAGTNDASEAARSLLAANPPKFAEKQMAELLKILEIKNGLSSYDYIERGERDGVVRWSEFSHVPDRTAEKTRRKEEKKLRLACKRALMESGVLFYDSELVRTNQRFARWHSSIFGSPPDSDDFLVTGFNGSAAIVRWKPPAEPVPLGAECTPGGNTKILFLPAGRVVAATTKGTAVLEYESGVIVEQLNSARGDPIAYDAKKDVLYLSYDGTLIGVSLSNGEIVLSSPFQRYARFVHLHPTQPHLIWSTQRTLGITCSVSGKSLLEVPLYNMNLVAKKTAQWEATAGGVPMRNADVLEREDFLSMQLDRTGERLFAGTTEGVREYRYSEVLSAMERMPLPTAGFEVSEKLQDHRWVNSIALDEKRSRLVYSSGDDSIRFYDWVTRKMGVLKAPSEEKRVWKLNLSGDASRLFCHLGAGGNDRHKRQEDHWVQVWNYEHLCASSEPVTI